MTKQKNTLAKLLDGTLSEAEKSELASDPDYAVYQKIKKYSAELLVPDQVGEEEMLAQIIQSPKAVDDAPRRMYRHGWLAVAASIVLLLLAGLGYVYTGSQTFTAGATANVHLQLPDASEVDLRNGSTLEFNQHTWPWKRLAKLTGEAYFNVEKGRVFAIETTAGTVRVLGTRFDVRNRDGHLSVNCYHGKVEVTHQGTTMLIREGESLSVKDNNWERAAIFLTEPGWTKGQLIFQSASLREVSQELKKAYAIELVLPVGDEQVNRKQFSGVLPFTSRETAMKIVEKAFAVSFVPVAANRYQISQK